MPYYAVACGHTPGIYRNWSDCVRQVYGYPRNDFRKRFCYRDAERFLSRRGIRCEYDCGDFQECEDHTGYTYYAVADGCNPGIYHMPWFKCKNYVYGPGTKYRKFFCLPDARYFMKRQCTIDDYFLYSYNDLD